jgi:hypothetical protein
VTIELAGQVLTIAAVIGFGVWNDRRMARLFREVGDRLDVINTRLGALEAKSNGSEPHAHLIDSGQMRRTAN